jgi:hypothetical protein
MVILQSCEKERVEVTEPEQEHQEEIITADKLLERESAVYLYLQRNWGTYYITDKYVDVILADDHYITNVYVHSTKAISVKERISGGILVPVDLNMGYPEKYPEEYLKKHPDKRRDRVFLVLEITKHTGEISCINTFKIGKYNVHPAYVFPYLDYSWCNYISPYRGSFPFNIDLCNLNRGTNGHYMYLFYKKSETNNAIRILRITYSNQEEDVKKLLSDYGFTYDNWDMNYKNSSPIKIYLGWRH